MSAISTNEAILRFIRGVGNSRPAELVAFMQANFPDLLEDRSNHDDPEFQALLQANFVRLWSLSDPQAALPWARQLLDGLRARSPETENERALLQSSAAALRKAGLFEESAEHLAVNLDVATTLAGRRQASLELAGALRRAGRLTDALALVVEVAAARRALHPPTNMAVLEADEDTCEVLLALSTDDALDRWLDLRERRLRANGLEDVSTARAFRGVATCWLRAGNLPAALGCIVTANQIRETVEGGRRYWAELDSASADVYWEMACAKVDRRRNAAAARRHAQIAAKDWAYLYGSEHEVARNAATHPALT